MADAKAAAERLERRIEEQLHAAERAQKMTIGIGLVLIVIVIGYFVYINSLLKKITPNDVVDMAIEKVEAQIPEWREQLVAQVKANSGQYINDAVNELVTKIPQGRAQVDSYARSKFDEILAELRTQIDQYTEYAIEKHRDQVNEFMDNLDSDAEAVHVEQQLYEILMEPVEMSSLKSDLKTYGAALSELADKVDRLVDNNNLTDSERVERDILISLKVLSSRSNEQGGIPKISLKAK